MNLSSVKTKYSYSENLSKLCNGDVNNNAVASVRRQEEWSEGLISVLERVLLLGLTQGLHVLMCVFWGPLYATAVSLTKI